MALQDRETKETIDSRNAVKAYVYDMTCKVRIVLLFFVNLYLIIN